MPSTAQSKVPLRDGEEDSLRVGSLRNSSYRSYLRVQGMAIAIDEAKIVRSERSDGKYVPRSHHPSQGHSHSPPKSPLLKLPGLSSPFGIP